MMLKLTQIDQYMNRDHVTYVNADHITCVSQDSPTSATMIALLNGGYIPVKEDVDTVLCMMQTDIRLTPEEWRERRNK